MKYLIVVGGKNAVKSLSLIGSHLASSFIMHEVVLLNYTTGQNPHTMLDNHASINLVLQSALLHPTDDLKIILCIGSKKSLMLTLSRATEQYCAAGAVQKPLCLSKQ